MRVMSTTFGPYSKTETTSHKETRLASWWGNLAHHKGAGKETDNHAPGTRVVPGLWGV